METETLATAANYLAVMPPHILLVDDEANIRRMLGALLSAEGYLVAEAESAVGALERIGRGDIDAILLDVLMPPGPDGLQTLNSIRERGCEAPVIMMSGEGELPVAVRATNLGAFQFLGKPLAPEAVLVTVRAALDLRRIQAENRELRAVLGRWDELVGASQAIAEVRALIAQTAPTDARVLITGEAGTGKKLVAAAIHRASGRARYLFVPVDCAAIPSDRIESELFGDERRAPTAAHESRMGRFELAQGGTLLLDEVGDLNLETQAKLLWTLESGDLQRRGSERVLRVNVRVIAATNHRLDQTIAAGRFRKDLYDRLNTFPIHLPPLRERLDDLPALVAHLAARVRSRRPMNFTASGLAALADYRWPGNVRELANFVERLAIGAGETVNDAQVCRLLAAGESMMTETPVPPNPIHPDLSEASPGLSRALEDYERGLIAAALKHGGGNVAAAARLLKTDRGNLYRRMRRLGMLNNED